MLGRLLWARGGGARPGLAASLGPQRPRCDAAAPNLEHVSAALGLAESDERRRQLHLAMLEYGELRIAGGRVPGAPTPADWAELLRLPTYSARRKYMAFLFKREKSREADERRRQRRAAERREQEAQQDAARRPGHLRYGLGHNTIFHRINDATVKSWEEQRLYTAMQFGQPLVIDLGYEEHMTRRENRNTAQQLCLLYSQNRTSLQPFDVHVCNVNPEGEILEFLRRMVPNVTEPAFPMHLHEVNYLDLYPREQLVYLTPHCRRELHTFDHDAVYIVGGVVDLVKGRPLSLAKAKKEGLKMAKLPLNKYLSLGPAFNPSLTLVAMIGILLELQATGDWERALRHVPRRSLVSAEQQQAQAEEERQRLEQARAAAHRRRLRWEGDQERDRLDWPAQSDR